MCVGVCVCVREREGDVNREGEVEREGKEKREKGGEEKGGR